MATIKINGVSVNTRGRNVLIHNGRVIVDGVDVTADAKTISITIAGDVNRLEADVCEKIAVTGKVRNINTMSGDVEVHGNVDGSVQTMSGNIDCEGSIGGDASSLSGSIKHRK